MSLKDDLQEISGVGEKTAEEIVAVVESHDTGGVDRVAVEKALRFAESGHLNGCREALRDALE